jgi:uncharacterized Zn finger protein (UPF0148 family)
MAISFACACGKRFRAGLGAAGKRVRCPACGAAVTVPKAEVPAATEEEREPESSAAEKTRSIPTPRPAPAAAPPPPSDHAAARAAALERYKSVLKDKPKTSLKEHAYWHFCPWQFP